MKVDQRKSQDTRRSTISGSLGSSIINSGKSGFTDIAGSKNIQFGNKTGQGRSPRKTKTLVDLSLNSLKKNQGQWLEDESFNCRNRKVKRRTVYSPLNVPGKDKSNESEYSSPKCAGSIVDISEELHSKSWKSPKSSMDTEMDSVMREIFDQNQKDDKITEEKLRDQSEKTESSSDSELPPEASTKNFSRNSVNLKSGNFEDRKKLMVRDDMNDLNVYNKTSMLCSFEAMNSNLNTQYTAHEKFKIVFLAEKMDLYFWCGEIRQKR
jgi:hypothetical protein